MGRKQLLSYDVGNEPYLDFCYAAADAKRVRPLLVRLRRRGVRVWVAPENAGSREAQRQRMERMFGASLVLVYLTAAFRTDTEAKAHALACQMRGQPLLCLNIDGGNAGLSIGLHPDTPQLQLKGATPEEIEDALLRADGFTQELIGEPVRIGAQWVRTLAIVIVVLAALVLGGTLAYSYLRPKEADEPVTLSKDTITFSDPLLTEAVRDAVDGPITEEAVLSVTSLRFTLLPNDLSELSRLPNLTCIELDQSTAIAAAEQVWTLSDTYEVVLRGGGGS